jgi:hypothetical protein
MRLRGDEFPGFERIMKGHDDREAFEFSLRHLIKGVGSFRAWDKVVGTYGSKLSEILTYSDEAWFLLIVENYEEVWKAAMGLRDPSDTSPIEAKWTGKEKHNNRKGMGMSFAMLIVVDGMML